MGRVYEERGAPVNLRWFWSLHGIVNKPLPCAPTVLEQTGERIEPGTQQQALPTPATQQPAASPAAPAVNSKPPVRGIESALCIKRNDDECVAVIQKRVEPGSQHAATTPGA